MSEFQLFVILFFSTLVITTVTFFIRRKISKHLDAKKAKYTHLFVAFVALYYLVDTLVSQYGQREYFIVFWVVVIGLQVGFWVCGRKV